jgi:signal transduction histidine kinase
VTELPTPRRVALSLGAAGAALAVVATAVVAVIFEGSVARESTVPAGLTAGALVLLGVGGGVVETLLRGTPLYRNALRREVVRSAPPPSRTALLDVQAAPVRAVIWFLIAFVLAALVIGLVFPAGGANLLVITLMGGVAFAAVTPVFVLYRRTLAPWISAFPASEVAHLPPPSGRDIALLVSSSVLSVGLVATTVAAMEPSTRAAALGLGVSGSLLMAVAAGVTAIRLSSPLRRDLDLLRQGIDARAAGEAEAKLVRSDADPLVTSIARAVETRVRALRASAMQEQRATSSIAETQRAKTIFMASMSHDLRGPLNSILGFSELLSSGIGGQLAEGQRESVAVIQRSGSELLELLNDIIDSARLDAGRLPLRREWTPCVELLTEAIQKGRDMVALRTGTGKGFTIVEELQPGLPPVHVDSQRVVQALLCIFRHATRAMEGGAIQLSARKVEAAVQVTVRDSGTTVMGDDRERVFEAFRALTSASGRRIGGMGLSLSLARALVRAHGGDVFYDASSDSGTTFHVSIPIGEE